MALPWYKDGLNFKCTECGKCCSGPSGFIWITEEDAISMSKTLGISVQEFKLKYIRKRDNRLALVEKKNKDNSYDCVFLKDKKCLVYQSRPKQCRTFPWWQENLNSPESWALAAQDCEGINPSAPKISYEEIQAQLNTNTL